MKYLNIKYFDFSFWALLFSLLIVLSLNFKHSNWNKPKGVIMHDVFSYYSYLPAIFVLNDLSLESIKNPGKELGGGFYGKKTPTGKTVISALYGTSLIYSPFFMVAHLTAQKMGYEPNGYSVPYKFALVMSSLFYLFIGMVFLRRFLIKYFSKLVVGIVIIVVVLTTNLLYYVTNEAPMTHVYSFALISVFLYVIDRWLEHPTIKYTILTGLLVGIISLVRPTNVVVVILLILWKITSWKDVKERMLFFIGRWYLIVLMLAMFCILWMPQLIYWKYMTGSFFYYSYPESQGFYFSNPQLFNTLFSWRKGLFIYTPVMVFAIIGIGILFKSKKELFWPVFVYFLISWYIISSWWDWWYGGSFGLRAFIDSYGVYSIGLAAFLSWVLKTTRLKMIIILTLFLLSAILGGWHYKRYHGGSIHWVAMTREAYFDSFWSAKPSPDFKSKLRRPDYKLARKGIYKYEDENYQLQK